MKPRIYILDDNQMMRLFLESYFSENYTVETFDSAFQLLEALDFTPLPDLIVMDYSLPDINGLQLLETLKSSEIIAKVPMIFISGHQESEVRIKCLKAGAADYITKPFNPVELNVRVLKHLKSQQGYVLNS